MGPWKDGVLGDNNKNNITKKNISPCSPDSVLGTAPHAFHILTSLDL